MNPTREYIESLISPDARAYANALGDDWCHPKQLRTLRALADRVAPRHTPESCPEGHRANAWLNSAPDEVVERWVELVTPWSAFERGLSSESAYGHLIKLVAGNVLANWRFYEAPLKVREG